jgi:CheY-like chemotaxis protein
MEQSFFDLAKILVCDPIAANRAATRSALYALGCRQIEMVASLRDLCEALDQRPPDLALCEAQVGEAELCRTIQQLRQDRESSNPFVIIIITAWAISASLSAEISKSGADGVIVRPFSAGLLEQRIRAHVFRRRRFIVSADYVGPERREEIRASTVPSFDPPNSLKMKAENRPDVEGAMRLFAAELQEARTKLEARLPGQSCLT